MGVQDQMQTMLAVYPLVDTQQALAIACREAKSVLLCGKVSYRQGETIAKMMTKPLEDSKVLYLALSFAQNGQGKVLPNHDENQENLQQWFEKSVCSDDNIDVITIVMSLSDARKEQAVLQELLFQAAFVYTKTVVAVVDMDKPYRNLSSWFPVHTDTLLLLPDSFTYPKTKRLMQEIYERDYTIAGVVEETMFADLHQTVRV